MGSHIDFKRGIWKYGSVKQMPQYPVIERFAKEGQVSVFSCDKQDYTKELPKNCKHVRLYSRFMFMMLSWLVIAYVSRKENIKYVYYNSGSSIFGLPLVRNLSSAKTILFYGVLLHANATGMKRTLYKVFERWSLRYVNYFIVGSDEIYEFILTSRYNGITLPVKKGVRLPKPDPGIKRKVDKRVIWCGRLEPVKDPLRAIQVFKKHVLPKHPDAELVLCGGGSLMARAKNEEDDKNIFVLGQRHDMPFQFQISQMLLITSKYEGSPDICLEAMALGLPIVSTNVGGVSNYVKDNENGLLVETDKQMGDAINYFLDNPKIADHMGHIGEVNAWEYHDLGKNTDWLVKVLVWWNSPKMREKWLKQFKATLQKL
ncbi:MAG: glycosyltransferase family 4 protein [Candidatus Thorarchaeota archaeon]